MVVNWDSVAWMFNYKEVTGLAHDFFNPYQNSNLLVDVNMPVAQQIVTTNPATGQVTYNLSDSLNSLEIPSIKLTTAVIVGQSTDNTILQENLDNGAVYYPGSVLPGENGQIVILGHSAPPNWPKIKHDYIFTNIEKLNFGDRIILNFNNMQYTYKVIDKKVIAQGQEAGSVQLTGSNNILTLISCWPPGKNYQRIAVVAELVKN